LSSLPSTPELLTLPQVILSIVLFFGGGPSHDNLGFRYWSPHNPGAFAPYLASSTNTTTSRFLAYWTATIRAGFAFILSPELLAVAAGEAIAPRRNLPKAARRYIYRLALFYGFGSLAIGILVPHNDSRLLSPDSNASASPFVSLTSPPIKQYGLPLTSSPWIGNRHPKRRDSRPEPRNQRRDINLCLVSR